MNPISKTIFVARTILIFRVAAFSIFQFRLVFWCVKRLRIQRGKKSKLIARLWRNSSAHTMFRPNVQCEKRMLSAENEFVPRGGTAATAVIIASPNEMDSATPLTAAPTTVCGERTLLNLHTSRTRMESEGRTRDCKTNVEQKDMERATGRRTELGCPRAALASIPVQQDNSTLSSGCHAENTMGIRPCDERNDARNENYVRRGKRVR